VIVSPKPTSTTSRTCAFVMQATSSNANAAVLLRLADEADGEGPAVEAHAVVGHVERDHLGEDLAHMVDARVAEAEQVEIAGCGDRSPPELDRPRDRRVHTPRSASGSDHASCV
jgi:hypothetical protein